MTDSRNATAGYLVHARLTAEDVGKLTDFCTRASRSRSDVVRALVVEQAEAYRTLAIPSQSRSQHGSGRS
jgi:hypothetical protein